MLPSGIKTIHSSAAENEIYHDHSSDAASSPEAEYQASPSERPRTLLERMLASLGMSTRRRRDAKADSTTDGWADGLLKRDSRLQDTRRRRRISAFDFVKRTLLALPVVVLVVLSVFTYMTTLSEVSTLMRCDIVESCIYCRSSSEAHVSSGTLTETMSSFLIGERKDMLVRDLWNIRRMRLGTLCLSDVIPTMTIPGEYPCSMLFTGVVRVLKLMFGVLATRYRIQGKHHDCSC